MQNVLHFNSRTQAPDQGSPLFTLIWPFLGCLALPGGPVHPWCSLSLSFGQWGVVVVVVQNHLASHSCWRICSLGLDAFLAISEPEPPFVP